MSSDARQGIGKALGLLPSGCCILTSAGRGRSTGMLASWVQQAAFEPPMVTIAVKKGRPIEAILDESAHCVLNLLPEDPTPMFKHFGQGFGPDDRPFDALDHREISEGIILGDAIAHLACKIANKFPAGDHNIYVCEILSGQAQPGATPYVHLRKSGFGY